VTPDQAVQILLGKPLQRPGWVSDRFHLTGSMPSAASLRAIAPGR
jgi:hypothetical protein